MVNWGRRALVYVHSAICETSLVYQYSIHLLSIGGRGPWYMCILLYVILIQCSGILEIYGHLEEGGGQNLVVVVVIHRSMIIWGAGHLRVHLI